MKKIKFEFRIATNYINSEWSEDVEIQFAEDATETEIEDQVNEIYTEWLFEKNQGGWNIVSLPCY